MRFLSFAELPLWARVALERLDADSKLRTGPQLDTFLRAYAATYGEAFNPHDGAYHEQIATSADRIACQRWTDYMS